MLHLALVVVLIWKFIWEPNIPEYKYVEAPIQARIATAPKSNPPPETSKPKVDEEKEKQKKLEQERLEKQKREAERLKEERQNKIQQEKKAAEQEAKEKAAKEKAEQERKKTLALEKKKKEEEKRKKEEAEKKRKAEAEKKRLAEEKRKKEAAEKKRLAEEKRKKEEAEKKRLAEEKRKKEKLERLQKALAAEDSEFFDAMEGDVKKAQIITERDKYLAMIDAKIQQNWYKPQNPGTCKVRIKTGPGGVVLDARVVDGTDDATCDTGLAAIYRSEPLPYPEDPAVIEELRVFSINFGSKAKD